MKYRLMLVVSFLSLSVLHADDEVFTSLTRRPTTMDQLPTNVSVITAEQIKDSGAKTLGDFLDQSVGIDVSRTGSLGSLSSVRVRGVPASNQVQIMIDDQPVGGVSVQEINVSLIPVENIDHVEIVRGGSSVLYGANTIGGVVRVITKKQTSEKPTSTVNAEAGSLGTKSFSAQAGGRGERTDGYFTLSKFDTDGFQQNSDAQNFSATGSAGFSFQNGARLSLDGSTVQRELGSPNGTPVPFDQWDGHKEREAFTLTERIDDTISHARVGAVIPVSNQLNVQSTVYGSDENYNLRLSAGSDPLSQFENRIVGQDTRFLYGKGFMFGGSYERDDRDSLGQDSHHVTDWGLYAQQQFSSGRLDAIPALRFDQHGTFGNTLNPRLALVFHAADHFKVSADVARSFRAPTLVDLYIVSQDPFFPEFDFFGNPNLKPETAWTYDLGASVLGDSHSELGVTAYFTRINDRITAVDTDGNGNNDTLKNLSVAELSGIEVTTRFTTGPLEHQGNYTLQQSKGSSATSTQFVQLRLTSHQMANYSLVCHLPWSLQATNSLQYMGKQYQNDGNQGKILPSYLLWNVRVEKKFGGLSPYFMVQNLTARIYSESFNFGNQVPMPGRTFWGGATMKFGE